LPPLIYRIRERLPFDDWHYAATRLVDLLHDMGVLSSCSARALLVEVPDKPFHLFGRGRPVRAFRVYIVIEYIPPFFSVTKLPF
jgi:hypothetical protein